MERGREKPHADPATTAPAPIKAPVPSLPKGGGAIQGIGEKLSTNTATGTASLTVPIAVPSGRGGFIPQLGLSYDSGAGNGPFGIGWHLSTPAITRKTDKGLPRYLDAEESDVFVLSGAEDLVPVRGPAIPPRDGHSIKRYRPRVEGLFARIERWSHDTTGEVHWRVITREDVTHLYGLTAAARIADPAETGRVFSWLLEETRDDRGNVARYIYLPEDGAGVDPTKVSEASRFEAQPGGAPLFLATAQRYLKRIQYGNVLPLSLGDPAPDSDVAWQFDIVLDYGEHHPSDPTPTDYQGQGAAWPLRPDPFSTSRAGFEVRTCRLCRRVLVFHRFKELGAAPRLVRSTDFTYDESPILTYLTSIEQAGYDTTPRAAGYTRAALPPLALDYARLAELDDTVQTLPRWSLDGLPGGVDGTSAQWVDLDGEGIPGVLSAAEGGWYYRSNLGRGQLAAPALLRSLPRPAELGGGYQQFVDLEGDGRLELVRYASPLSGYFTRTQEGGWESFREIRAVPSIDWNDANLRTVDLDGDGHPDVLITEHDAFVWYRSLADEGFEPARRTPRPWDEDKGPAVVFADGTESIHLADMSGDGLADLVRVRCGEVCYWPNLGYGHFGPKVTMERSPRFDVPDQFDPKRIRFADVDGSGTTDILYLGREGVAVYLNQSGNGFAERRLIRSLPLGDTLSSTTVVDLLGQGTSCLVWSSSAPGDARRPLAYIDLMGGRKPHVLVSVQNNLGAETRVRYAPSTRFYLEDKAAGRPWITRLPFPVHVVERMETFDRISQSRFVTRYAYHHGYFDGVEREFRGFGMVEQWDTEELAALTGDGTLPEAENLDAASHVPPVLTRTWFHTGIYLNRDHVSDFFAGLGHAQDLGEYYREPGLSPDEVRARLLPDTVMPDGLTLAEQREACRALKGMTLRREVYALDRTDEALVPYTVTEQNFTIRPLQTLVSERHAVFFSHPRETVSTHYERNPEDPRVRHELTLEVDEHGNVQRSLAIGYGRRTPSTDTALTDDDRAGQTRSRITYTENAYAIPLPADDHHRTPLPAETRTYELTGFTPENSALRFSFDEWTRDGFALLASATEIPHEATPDDTTKQRRLTGRSRTLYRSDDLAALLPFQQVGLLALPGETYKLALTPGLLSQVLVRPLQNQPDEDLLPNPGPLLQGTGDDEGGYVAFDGGFWIPSGRVFFDPAADIADPASTAAQELAAARQHFFVTRKFTDPFGHSSVVDYDVHDLLVVRSTDALGNIVAADNDYRVLQPSLVTDPNGNRTAAAFDALGLLVATAVMGKTGQLVGDLLEGFEANPTLADLQAFVADPEASAPSLLGRASTRIVYDLTRWRRADQPPFAATLARETHHHDPGGAATRIQIGLSYSDGFGRELQKKIRAEAGDAPQRAAPVPLPGGDLRPGDLVRDAEGRPVLAAAPARWVGSGRTVFNNKGKPIRQYEPFFSATHLYEPERDMTDTGVSPVLFYDPVERVVATLHPNHTYEKVVHDPWRQATYDVNDTIAPHGTETGDPRTDLHIAGYVRAYFDLQPAGWQTWHAQRIGGQLGAAELDAAQKAEAHADTPTVAHLDALGRPFVTIAQNRYERNGVVVEEDSATRVELDIEGRQRAVSDARERVVMRYDYDLLGNRIHQAGMDGGERWVLSDVSGNPIRVWDSRGFTRRLTYDELRRGTGLYVTEAGAERLAERTVYGEGQGAAQNHRTRAYQLFDGAGVVTSVAYDFKGNVRESRRDLLPSYRLAVNWLDNPVADYESFTSQTTYDALNRTLTATSPDGSVYRPTFNEANLLDTVDVNVRGAAATHVVTNIDYDAKGRRTQIAYGNGALTVYEHDPLTHRLTHLTTTRPANLDVVASQLFEDATVVQDLRYTYDPAGNVTRVEDAALLTVFHGNQQIDPVGIYTYDALYRLIEARGREHIGQTAFDFDPPDRGRRDHPFAGSRVHPSDLQALRNYTERYEYDAAGNIEVLRHIVSGGGWTRRYDYEEDSLLEAGEQNNRLTRTTVGNGVSRIEPYSHDDHGNMTSMPHLATMAWDFEDQLHQVDLGGGGTAYYVYDAAGQRARKVIESQGGTRRSERIYLAGFELYREFDGHGEGVLLARQSLHVMDDKQRIALVETQTVEDGVELAAPVPLQRYQLGNFLGSACVELAEDGALISYEEYHPYGTTAFQAGRSAAEVSLKRYRYTGKERDDETGLAYHSARYYSPWLGRWMAADPGGLIDGPNLYRYGRNNPVLLNDPSGMDPPIVNNGDQNDPRNYLSLEHFRAGVSGPWSDDVINSAWESGQPPSEAPLQSVPPPVLTTTPNPPTSPPPSSQSEGWQLTNNPIWNVVTNNTVSGTTALLENGWIGVYTLPSLTRRLMSVDGVRGLEAGLRLEDALSAPATASPWLLAPRSALGGISRASAALAPLGVVSNSQSLSVAISPSAGDTQLSGLERIGEGGSSAAGLFSSTVGTVGLAGWVLNAAGATTAGGALVSSASVAGPAAGVAGAGAGGYAAGRLLDTGAGALMNWTGASAALDRTRGIARPPGQHGDYSISGTASDLAVAIDQGAVSVLRSLNIVDTSRPAYTQTLGWQLGELLPRWMQ